MTGTKSDIVITVERREDTGKGAARRLRQEGRIPGVVYGGGKEPFAISVDRHSVQELLKQEAGGNTIFLLKLKGAKQERRAMIREIQIDPLTRQFIHIDFIRVTRGHKLNVTVPVELVGDCAGVRHGGLLDFVTREVQIEVLPREVPDKISVDISELDVDQHLTLADVEELLPSSARLLDDPARVLVTIAAPRGKTIQEEEAEAAAAAELVITEQAEPEVIHGKGREDQGEGAE